MRQQTEIQRACRSVAYQFAGKKAVRCNLCDALCESEREHDASGEYDALAKHLESEHPEEHDRILRRYESQDRRF